VYVKLLRNPDGSSKGRGFVKFETEEAINKAVQLNDKEMMGRKIKVEIPRNQSEQ
jgi:RNA recognition motif-containing protein